MIPQGKGLFISKIKQVYFGSAEIVAKKCTELALGWVAVKIADGAAFYNLRWNGKRWSDDILSPWVTELKDAGIEVYGWHQVYGYNPQGDATAGSRRILQLGLDGYIVHPGAEYNSFHSAAASYMGELVQLLPPKFDVGLMSFGDPEAYPDFPWEPFLGHASYFLPMVYWHHPDRMTGTTPEAELVSAIEGWSRIRPGVPFIPAGRAFSDDGYPDPGPKPEDLQAFMDACRLKNCQGAGFWCWEQLLQQNGGSIRLDAIRNYTWDGARLSIEQRISRLELVARQNGWDL